MISVGIDISKDTSTVCIVAPYGNFNKIHLLSNTLRNRGKKVAKVAGLNKFSRIYYAKVRDAYLV